MYDYEKIDRFLQYGLEISQTKSSDEAFLILTSEIEKIEDRYLNDYISALNLY